MNKFLTIAIEVGVSLVMIAVAVGINWFLFKDDVAMDIEVPEHKAYASVTTGTNNKSYDIVGADKITAKNETETYEANSSELELYQTEIRYVPGTANPFESNSSESNLPNETVSSPIGGSTTVPTTWRLI